MKLTTEKSLTASICRGAGVAGLVRSRLVRLLRGPDFPTLGKKTGASAAERGRPRYSKSIHEDHRLPHVVSTHTKSDRACPVDFGAKTMSLLMDTDA